jgi:hypothetical protein
MSPSERPERGARSLVLAVFLALLAVYGATLATQPDVLDGEVEFQTTSSLVRRGTLALGGTPEAEGILAWDGGRGFNVRPGGPGREHERFSWFGVGQSFVGVPFYLAGAALRSAFPAFELRQAEVPHLGIHRSEYFEHLAVLSRSALCAAGTGALLVSACLLLGLARRTAALAGLAYGLTTFAWPQARTSLDAVQSTFLLAAALHEVLALRARLAAGAAPSAARLALLGALLGLAFLTRSLTAPVLVVLGGAALVLLLGGRRARAGELAALALPALAAFGVFLWTNWLRFGDPLEQGYGGVVTWEGYFNYPLHLGLLGLLFAPGPGLAWTAPLALVGLIGLPRLWIRGERFVALVLALAVAAVLLPVAKTLGWHGGWNYGSRYALPALPFLWLAAATALPALWTSVAGKALVLALGLAGFLGALGGTLVDTTTHLGLAIQAARLEWPELAGASEADREAERFQRIATDLDYAAPLAHWRILRHRLAGKGETFSPRELFGVASDEPLTLPEDRDHGFRHLAWVDFRERLGGSLVPILVVSAGLLVAAAALARRSLRQVEIR